MTSKDVVMLRLKEMGIQPLGIVGSGESDDDPVMAYISAAPSRKAMSSQKAAKLRDELLQEGVHATFILSDTAEQEIESGLRAKALALFSDLLRNVFFSVVDRKGVVWLDQKVQLTEAQEKKIQDALSSYLSVFRYESISYDSLRDKGLPTNFYLLRVLRHIAPADIGAIKEEAERKGKAIPSDDWLKRRMDQLRKNGLVVWVSGDKYVLSLRALKQLGSTKNRLSMDVARMLALARRR